MNCDEANDFLFGEASDGLKAVFTMMNKIRLGVGLLGLTVSEISCQNAAVYAKDRIKGRSDLRSPRHSRQLDDRDGFQ